jgi:transposase
MWEEQGVWLRAWQALLARMDKRKLLDWEEAFLDATFVIAKKGALRSVRVPHSGRGRPRKRLRRVIADKGYDSDPLRQRLRDRGTDLIVPYRSRTKNRRFEDKQKLRRYRRRWKIERTNAWLQNFRRIQVRYDRILSVYQGFTVLASSSP